MSKPLRLGIAGLGTVGVGVLRILRQQAALLEARTGCAMTIHANSILCRAGSFSTVFPYRVPLWQLRRMVSVEVKGDFYVEYSTRGVGRSCSPAFRA